MRPRVHRGLATILALVAVATVSNAPGVLAQGPSPSTSGSVPSIVPLPSFESDAELEALSPESIGGEPLMVDSLTGDRIFLDSDDEVIVGRVQELLAANDLALSDVALGFGYSPTSDGSITALRFPGADASAFLEVLIMFIGGSGEQSQVAGRDVLVVTTPNGGTQVVYTKDDVVWAIVADELALTEILEALP